MAMTGADEAHEVWRIGDLELDVGQQRLWRAGSEIALPKLSFDLLLALARRAPDVVTYDELMERVWPGLVVSPETIVQRVRLLRTAIGDDASEPRYVEALRSRGYRLLAGAVRASRVRPLPPSQPVAEHAWLPERLSAAMPVAPPLTATAPDAAPLSAPLTESPSWAPPAAAQAAELRLPSPRRRWVAVVIAAALALGVVLSVSRQQPVAPSPAPAASVTDATPQVEAAARATRTVAVLPFENLSADPADAVIAQAVPESTLDRLASLRGLTVIARDSAFRAGREGRTAREIGERLGAGWLVQGSVQRVGGRVRVVARLVDARADTQVWSERYEQPLADLPALQDELAARVADTLATRLAGLQRASQAGDYSRDVAANLAYLRGRAMLDRATIVGAEAAAAQFEDAIARDPRFAAAHAALYDARLQAASLRLAPVDAARERHAALIERALELDPRCGAALLARARWSGASPAARDADFRRGLELDPNDKRGMNAYAAFLQQQGRLPESRRWLARELLVDPLSTPALFRRATQTLDAEGAGVERAVLGVLERDPTYNPALRRYAKYRWQLSGEIAEALEILERAIASDPEEPAGRHLAATIYLDAGDPVAALDVARGAPVSAATTRTILALYAGRDDEAARAVLEPAAKTFNALESWGVLEALRDAALRDGAPSGSAFERLLADFPIVRGSTDPAAIRLNNYRSRILIAQLRLARAARERSDADREAALSELRSLVAWMDANERYGLHHHPRAQALLLLGEPDRALAELRAAFERDRDFRQWWYVLERDPTWASLRSDPRHKAIRDIARIHVERQRATLESLRRDGKVPRRGATAVAAPAAAIAPVSLPTR